MEPAGIILAEAVNKYGLDFIVSLHVCLKKYNLQFDAVSLSIEL